MRLRLFAPLRDKITSSAQSLGLPILAHDELASSLDHLVGAREQGRWNGNTNSPCGLKIDDQFELGRLDDGQLAGFFAFQHAAGVDTSLPISIWQTCPIAHQTAGIDEGFEWVNGGNRMMRGQDHE